MEIKKKKNLGVIILILLFIMFMSLYFTQVTDLYEYGQYNKMIMTKEAMERFEEDIASGKDIEIGEYLSVYEDYTNGVSDLGNKTSLFIEKIMGSGIKKAFKIISVLFT